MVRGFLYRVETKPKGIINIFDYKSGNKVSVDTSCRSVNYLKAVGDGYVIGCNSTRVFVIKNGCMELERSFPTIRFGSLSFFMVRLHTVSYGM